MVGNLRDDLRRLLREEKVGISGGIGVNARGVQVRIPDANDRARIMPKLAGLVQLSAAGGPGLDVSDAGDGLLKLTISDAAIDNKVKRAVEQTIEVLNRRVNGLGTTEPTSSARATTACWSKCRACRTPTGSRKSSAPPPSWNSASSPTPAPIRRAMSTCSIRPSSRAKLPVEKQVMVQGEDLTDAQPGFDSRTGEPVVNFRFNIRGGQRFGQVTSENVGRPFAIVLDNKVISAPRILGPITGGSGQISGHFTVEQANNLAILLRAGALPAKLTIVEERTVGPGLGQDSIDAGKRAAYVGGGSGRRLHADHLRHFRHLRRYRAAVHISFIFAALVLLRRDADAAGHRRHRADHRHGGRFQRADLRAHPRGGACWGARSSRRSTPASSAPSRPSSTPTSRCSSRRRSSISSAPARCAASPCRSALGILTTIVTAVTMTRMMIAALVSLRARPTKLPIYPARAFDQ